METMADTRDKLFDHLKGIEGFARVEKISVNRLADRTFWDGLNNIATPAGLLAMKRDASDGLPRRRITTWAFVLIVNDELGKSEEALYELAEAVRLRLTHAWPDSTLFLKPDSVLTMLETGPHLLAAELEIVTEDSE